MGSECFIIIVVILPRMNRLQALNEIINFGPEIELAKIRIQDFPFDTDEELIVINRHHVEKVLNMYIDGKISDETVEEWANFIEGREDLNCDVFGNLIFILANPILEGRISISTARKFLYAI
jgi:hypothetical protein